MSPTIKVCVLAIGLSAAIGQAFADTVVTERVLRIHEIDLALHGGLEPALERFYRSDVTEAGLFGPGWSSRYEARLTFPGNGTALIREYGCTREIVFKPTFNDNRLTTFRCGCQELVRHGDTWERRHPNGGSETFDVQGRMIRSRDANGNWVSIEHGPEGRLAAVTDNFGRRIDFIYRDDGRLARVLSGNGSQAFYEYDPKGRVTAVTDGNGLVHEYIYDDQDRVTEISRTKTAKSEDEPGLPSSRATVVYDPAQPQAVLEFVPSDGSVWTYASAETDGYRLFDETRKDAAGGVLFQLHRLLLFRPGEKRYWREILERDGAITDIEYNRLGLPAIRKNGDGDETWYHYDDSGRMIRKQTRDEVTRVSYDAKTGKRSRIETTYHNGRRRWVSVRYNAEGNAAAIRNDRGNRISLRYDGYGRPASISDGHRRLIMTYNRDSQPTVLAMPGVGKVLVDYDRGGKIDKVSSEGGRKVALRITALFSKLQDVIREAGAN